MRRLSILVLLVAVAGFVRPVQAQELAASKAKKLNKEAAAVEKSDPAKAAGLYRQVADQAAKTGEPRADALYALLLLQVQRPDRDLAAARVVALQLIEGFPRDKRRPVAAALLTTLDAWSAAEAATAERDAQLAAARQAAEQAVSEKEALVAADKAQSGQKVEELETRLRKARAELEAAKVELAKKEEALQKLKKVVVGGG